MDGNFGGHGHQPLPHGPVQFAQIMAAARFPVYGVIGHPDGLTVQSLGSCSASDRREQPEVILQTAFRFGYPTEAGRDRFRLELTTTDPNQLAAFGLQPGGLKLPEHGDIYDTDGRLYTRYASLEEAMLGAGPVSACVIERFPLAQEIVVAELRHWTRPNPEWLFTLTRPGLHLDGRAWEYTQTELFELLGHVGLVSDQPHVLAQYQSEIAGWTSYFHPDSDSA